MSAVVDILLLHRLATGRTIIAEERLPALLPDALPRRGAPLQAIGRRFTDDLGLALGAFDPELIGEHLHPIAALRTRMQADGELLVVLSGAFSDWHGVPPLFSTAV